jgi:hypothetical protein
MKRTKQDEEKWYLFVDGKSIKVTNAVEECSQLKRVIIEITAHEAANILALALEAKES